MIATPHIVSYISETVAGEPQFIVLTNGHRRVFTGNRAIRIRNIVRQLEAAFARPEGVGNG